MIQSTNGDGSSDQQSSASVVIRIDLLKFRLDVRASVLVCMHRCVRVCTGVWVCVSHGGGEVTCLSV